MGYNRTLEDNSHSIIGFFHLLAERAEPVSRQMSYKRSDAPKLIDDHLEWLWQALQADAHRARSDRRTALKLHAQLKERGFSRSYCRVAEAIRAWRAEARPTASPVTQLGLERRVRGEQCCRRVVMK